MYVIEEPQETDGIVIRRATQMLGIRRVTISKRKTLMIKKYILFSSQNIASIYKVDNTTS